MVEIYINFLSMGWRHGSKNPTNESQCLHWDEAPQNFNGILPLGNQSRITVHQNFVLRIMNLIHEP